MTVASVAAAADRQPGRSAFCHIRAPARQHARRNAAAPLAFLRARMLGMTNDRRSGAAGAAARAALRRGRFASASRAGRAAAGFRLFRRNAASIIRDPRDARPHPCAGHPAGVDGRPHRRPTRERISRRSARDAEGRLQYRYHDDWTVVRDKVKAERLLRFGRALPKIRARIEKDLARRKTDRRYAAAVAGRLIDRALLRSGHTGLGGGRARRDHSAQARRPAERHEGVPELHRQERKDDPQDDPRSDPAYAAAQPEAARTRSTSSPSATTRTDAAT